MKGVIFCFSLLMAMLVSTGCLDASRAAKQSVDPTITEKVSEKYTDKSQLVADMRKVMASGLFIADRTMFNLGMIIIDDNAIKFNYGKIKGFSIHSNGTKARVTYDTRRMSNFRWQELKAIQINGPFVRSHDMFKQPLVDKDYYIVSIITKGWGGGRRRKVEFGSLDAAKVFAALAVRMAELSGNQDVNNDVLREEADVD